MPRPSRMLRVESFSVMSVTTDRGWNIEKARASRDVLPLGRWANSRVLGAPAGCRFTNRLGSRGYSGDMSRTGCGATFREAAPRLRRAQLEHAIETLRRGRRSGYGRRWPGIEPIERSAVGGLDEPRRAHPREQIGRVFDLIIPAGRSVPSHVNGALSRRGLHVERHKGQRNKARALQSPLDLGVLHEKLPNLLRPIVLDHDHNRPLINSQLIGIVPTLTEVKRVAKAIRGPNVNAEAVVKSEQGRQGVFGPEGHGPTRRSGSNRAII